MFETVFQAFNQGGDLRPGFRYNDDMMHSSRAYLKRLPIVFLLGLLLFGSTADAVAQSAAARAEQLFTQRVLPVLRVKCFACHGEDTEKLRGGFNMLSREGLLAGGESGRPSVIPGKPEESLLYQAVRWQDLEMPPKENDRLTQEQIRDIRDWIAGDVPWPEEARQSELQRNEVSEWNEADGVQVHTSGGLSQEWTQRRYDPKDLWAYRPVRRQTLELNREDGRHPIDGFIDNRLADLGITAAPAADRRTLIRWATFDLLGLPPTPGEVLTFVNDPLPDDQAFAKVVERLLESPHYGEQWGRHWLDVVRYADSSGYANDFERGNAWRYRDYVVRAFNEDKPYDTFIKEQIAGDEIDASNPELLIAAGFLRMGPWELTAMEVPKVARQRYLDDVTDALGQVFSSLSTVLGVSHGENAATEGPGRDELYGLSSQAPGGRRVT